MSEITAVDVALFYAERGWNVFPVRPRDKTPLIAEPPWNEIATTDRNKILGWWEFNPNANVGIATGSRSGIFVLDVDGEDGEQTLSKLIAKHGTLPATPIATTGKGRHFIFAYPAGRNIRNTAKKIGAGLDTRGDGGYIVAPPSVHPSGRMYQWHKDFLPSKTPIAEAPEWLLKLLEQPEQQQDEQKQQSGGVFTSGQRNSALTSLAGSMRRKGFDFESILVALLAENRKKCVPPLPDAEVRKIAESVMRYGATTEPMMEERDRVQAEWGFCHSIYIEPAYIKDFLWLTSDKFADEKLARFWQRVLDGEDVVAAAAAVGVLADLEKFDSDVFKVDGYAKTIAHFGYLDTVKKYGYQLQKEAEIGDTTRIDFVVGKITTDLLPQTHNAVAPIVDVADEVEEEVRQREANPVDVWGIPYSPYSVPQFAWSHLSVVTGGKQLGELIMLAGEPGVGKSWWAIQDALFTGISGVPVYIWSGEMNRKQVLRRMYQILGVNGRAMKTGRMTEEDWQALAEAKALVLNSPIYIDDTPGISLHELRARVHREVVEHGIQQFVIDYAYLVDAPGRDEIEKTGAVSRAMKILCSEGEGLAGVMIASVTKSGMDNTGDKALKSNVRGSGQMIHDADVVYHLTQFAQISNDNVALRYMPSDYDRLATLHINKGRELEGLKGGRLHFSRIGNTPAWQEELQDKN